MEYFLQMFGSITLEKAAVVVGAAAFLIACYKKIAKYFTEKALQDKAKDERLQEAMDQAGKYPAEIEKLSEKIDEIGEQLQEMRQETGSDRATTRRYRILRFDDEIVHDEKHTKEHFDQILDDISEYEKYCNGHKEYKNSRAEMAIKNIKRVYEKCAREGTFL